MEIEEEVEVEGRETEVSFWRSEALVVGVEGELERKWDDILGKSEVKEGRVFERRRHAREGI